jgi:hypothetical protein
MWSALSAPSGKVRDALPTGRRGRSVRVARTDVDADLKARRESRQALGGQTANLAEVVLNLLPIGVGTPTIRPMLRRLVR